MCHSESKNPPSHNNWSQILNMVNISLVENTRRCLLSAAWMNGAEAPGRKKYQIFLWQCPYDWSACQSLNLKFNLKSIHTRSWSGYTKHYLDSPTPRSSSAELSLIIPPRLPTQPGKYQNRYLVCKLILSQLDKIGREQIGNRPTSFPNSIRSNKIRSPFQDNFGSETEIINKFDID